MFFCMFFYCLAKGRFLHVILIFFCVFCVFLCVFLLFGEGAFSARDFDFFRGVHLMFFRGASGRKSTRN